MQSIQSFTNPNNSRKEDVSPKLIKLLETSSFIDKLEFGEEISTDVIKFTITTAKGTKIPGSITFIGENVSLSYEVDENNLYKDIIRKMMTGVMKNVLDIV